MMRPTDPKGLWTWNFHSHNKSNDEYLFKDKKQRIFGRNKKQEKL